VSDGLFKLVLRVLRLCKVVRSTCLMAGTSNAGVPSWEVICEIGIKPAVRSWSTLSNCILRLGQSTRCIYLLSEAWGGNGPPGLGSF
jgi:hypothetical protein